MPGALDRLARLDNVDKHRVPHAAWTTIDILTSVSTRIRPPEGFKELGGNAGTYAPLENDAEIGRWRFQTPLPSEWQPDEVDMKRQFPIEVAFGDVLPFQGVLKVLPLCLWGVESVLTIFDPAFQTPRKPPLPVTAIAEPGL